MKRHLTAAILALAAIGCGSDGNANQSQSGVERMAEDLVEAQAADQPDNAPACADVYAVGRPTDEITAWHDSVEAMNGCLAADGSISIQIGTSWECPDGRTVHQIGDLGWGFSGDVWHGPDEPEPYADCVLAGTDPQHP